MKKYYTLSGYLEDSSYGDKSQEFHLNKKDKAILEIEFTPKLVGPSIEDYIRFNVTDGDDPNYAKYPLLRRRWRLKDPNILFPYVEPFRWCPVFNDLLRVGVTGAEAYYRIIYKELD